MCSFLWLFSYFFLFLSYPESFHFFRGNMTLKSYPWNSASFESEPFKFLKEIDSWKHIFFFFFNLWFDIYLTSSVHIYLSIYLCSWLSIYFSLFISINPSYSVYFSLPVSVCLYLRGAFNKFPAFFVQAFKIVVGSWKFTMLLLYILWDDWPIFMISGSKEQLATTAIGIHPTKTWLSPLVNFKNAIWTSGHFRRTIWNKTVLNLEKYHRNVWNASDCFSTILHESSISFWVA